MSVEEYRKACLDWGKAPVTAEYLAQGGCGYWYWYELEPKPSEKWPHWIKPLGGQSWLAMCDHKNMSGWQKTLRRRPKSK